MPTLSISLNSQNARESALSYLRTVCPLKGRKQMAHVGRGQSVIPLKFPTIRESYVLETVSPYSTFMKSQTSVIIPLYIYPLEKLFPGIWSPLIDS